VRDLIEAVFRPASLKSGIGSQIYRESGTQLAALLTLTERIPEELVTLAGTDYSKYVMALETIRHQLSRWHHSIDSPTLPHVDG
jgi:hypothetical protein